MGDRIADPWGTRTPYARGAGWPVRADTHLRDGVAPDEVERWVPTASVLHSNGDALDIAVKDGRMVGVRGRAGSRVNHGRLGPRDLFGWQANGSPDRLTRPLVRRGGELVDADWDTAMEAFAERSRALLREQGPSAFAIYTSGELFLEEYYTLAVIGRAGLRTNHIDGNTRLCTATAAEALKETDADPRGGPHPGRARPHPLDVSAGRLPVASGESGPSRPCCCSTTSASCTSRRRAPRWPGRYSGRARRRSPTPSCSRR
jgi:anaerobic selenocysteine-containing dehydrogenase